MAGPAAGRTVRVVTRARPPRGRPRPVRRRGCGSTPRLRRPRARRRLGPGPIASWPRRRWRPGPLGGRLVAPRACGRAGCSGWAASHSSMSFSTTRERRSELRIAACGRGPCRSRRRASAGSRSGPSHGRSRRRRRASVTSIPSRSAISPRTSRVLARSSAPGRNSAWSSSAVLPVAARYASSVIPWRARLRPHLVVHHLDLLVDEDVGQVDRGVLHRVVDDPVGEPVARPVEGVPLEPRRAPRPAAPARSANSPSERAKLVVGRGQDLLAQLPQRRPRSGRRPPRSDSSW